MKATANRQVEELERVRQRIEREIRAVAALQSEQLRQAQDLQEHGARFIYLERSSCSFFYIDYMKRELSPVLEARFDGKGMPTGCLPHTRTVLLDQLHDWTTDDSESAPDVFVLTGLAGTGKTTVAQSLCVHFDLKLPGASFFATRSSAERRNPDKIIQTIVYQLGTQNTSIRNAIGEALRNGRDITTRPLAEQVQKLFTTPLKASETATSCILIVIDALDECDMIAGVEGGQLIALIVSAIRQMPGRVRLLITSREEPAIMRMLNRMGLNSPQSMIRLQNIEHAIVKADIEYFYAYHFQEVARQKGFMEGSWPVKFDFDLLVNLTGMLFVFAALVIRLVSNPRYDPKAQLEEILRSPTGRISGLTFGPLDELYLGVLDKAVKLEDGSIDDNLVARVRNVAGALVLLQSPLTPPVLSELLGEEVSSVTGDIQHLSAVLSIPDDAARPPTIFHPSFADFILLRCIDPKFKIDAQVYNAYLALCCLLTMNRYLKYDICNIGDPSQMNDEIKDLEERRSQFLPPELRYACEFWMVHLANASISNPALLEALNRFCSCHLLHWLEVLSLLGKLSVAHIGLPGVIQWCKVSRRHISSIYQGRNQNSYRSGLQMLSRSQHF